MLKTAKKISNITYITGDIFSVSKSRISLSSTIGANVIIPHVCNNIGVFGGGFSGSISNEFPIVRENFYLLGKKTKLGYVQFISVLKNTQNHNSLIVANMIAQNGTIGKDNSRPLNYEYLVKCMTDVRNYSENLKQSSEQNVEIHCPKFGSGLAGGNWNLIEYLIEDIWSNQKVFVYSYPHKSGFKK